MSRTSRLSFIGIAAITMALLAPSLASATHSWGGYHWARTSNPFTLKLDDNVSSDWDSYLGTTSSDWSTPPVGSGWPDVLNTPIGSAGTTCIATLGRVEVCNDEYGDNGWLGMAQIGVFGKHIVQGVVRLNDSYFAADFEAGKYNTPAWRNMVMCQEVGHTLGLDHQNATWDTPNLGTCMDYTDDPDGSIADQLSNEHPNQHDYVQLGKIYKHLDRNVMVSLSAASSAASGTSPSEWGREVTRSQDGRTSTFVRDLGAGNSIVTFVIWAD